jgi:hypothetical protein
VSAVVLASGPAAVIAAVEELVPELARPAGAAATGRSPDVRGRAPVVRQGMRLQDVRASAMGDAIVRALNVSRMFYAARHVRGRRGTAATASATEAFPAATRALAVSQTR